MIRDIDSYLRQWKDQPRRYPILVRGARQVGKSYTVSQFGAEVFDSFIEVNFEFKPEFKGCFEALEPKLIVENISLLTGQEIIPGQSLLFLDEIQECPKAIMALRYFYEQMPELHVIGAGSLLEFALESQNFKMPVGRIQYFYMQPLSFGEFLDACGEGRLRSHISELRLLSTITEPVHNKLIQLLRKYFILGGMPAVIDEYIASGNIRRCGEIQQIIIQTYRDDFGKYASRVKHRYLEKIFYAVPKMVGQKFKYSHVDQNVQSRELKEALEMLEKASVVQRVFRTSGFGMPLEANASERHFKVVFCDLGLMQTICGLEAQTAMATDLTSVNKGALAEQFVAQELNAYRDYHIPPSLHYWAREYRNSSAEVDYLMTIGSRIIPLEVKAGSTGRLRSMHQFFEQYGQCLGIKICQDPFSRTKPIFSIPLYGIKALKGILATELEST